MKKVFLTLVLVLFCISAANAQFGKINVAKATNAAVIGAKALTISDADIAKYCQEYMDWMDANNPLCSVDDADPGKKAVAERLAKIVENVPMDNVDGLKFEIKAYYVVDVNAFASANGSIRIFAGLMELMSDDEILAVIAHEIGHLANRDSKDAFKTALMTSALKEAVGATGNAAAALTSSQLGSLSEALANAQFSQKQENAADDYAFDFMKKVTKDPKSMSAALSVLLNLSADSPKSSKSQQLFSSHPEFQKRIDRLNKK